MTVGAAPAPWRTATIACVLVLAASPGALSQVPGRAGVVPACERRVALPSPSGPHGVGVVTAHWVDRERREDRTPDPDDIRQLMATVAYPADVAGLRPAPYLPELASVLGGLAASGRPGPRGLDEYAPAFACVDTESFAGAPAAGGPFPVVVLSPGGNVSRHWHTALAQDLASHGYVVAVLSHPHNGLDVFPAGGLVASSPYWDEDDPAINDELTERYATDLEVALDRLAAMNEADPVLAGRLDLERVGAVGYSRGGRAATRGCGRDPRFRACVVLESAPPQGAPGLGKPQMAVRVPWRHWDPARVSALRAHLAANDAPGYDVVLEGAAHFSFTDLPLIVRDRFEAEIDPARAHDLISGYTLAFLDAHLRGRGAALAGLALAPPDRVAVWANAASRSAAWHASPGAVAGWSEGEPGFRFDEADVPAYEPPNVLEGAAGPEGWAERRARTLALFREHVYGRELPRPDGLRFEVVAEDPGALEGAATLRRVAVHSEHDGRRHRFEVAFLIPNDRDGPAPVFLLLNHRDSTYADPTEPAASPFWPAAALVARGYAAAVVQTDPLAPDDSVRYRDGVLELLGQHRPGSDAPGALAAWAWGASRVLDYAEADSDLEAGRVAVVGHSRGGKAALWAAAEDERIAMVVSNNSGAGGAALSRRAYGETVGRITRTFPHWFAPAFAEYAGLEDALPIDQHQLMALVAPRALYVASADEDLWADPRGEFLSLALASPAYSLYGAPTVGAMPGLDAPAIWGRRGYHVRTGGHDLTRYDWDRFMDFADAVLGGR